MAHTLKAYYYTDPATAVTVDFMGAVATNSGIALDSYQMGVPGIDQSRKRVEPLGGRRCPWFKQPR